MSSQPVIDCAADNFWTVNPYQPPHADASEYSIWSEFTPDTIGMMVGGLAGLYFGFLLAQWQLADGHWLDQFVWADFGYAIGSFSGGLIGVVFQIVQWVRERRGATNLSLEN